MQLWTNIHNFSYRHLTHNICIQSLRMACCNIYQKQRTSWVLTCTEAKVCALWCATWSSRDCLYALAFTVPMLIRPERYPDQQPRWGLCLISHQWFLWPMGLLHVVIFHTLFIIIIIIILIIITRFVKRQNVKTSVVLADRNSHNQNHKIGV